MHDLALQEFHQALEINPRDAAALTGIARSDDTAGKTQEAEDGYKKAIAVLPDDWRGFNELGNFYTGQGKYAQAIAQYKQALELTPDNAQLYSNLGAAYLNSGDPKLLPDAEQSLKKALALHPSYGALANLAALFAVGNGVFAGVIAQPPGIKDERPGLHCLGQSAPGLRGSR